jgi:subtilisin-like proprotein convertase family protein
LGGGILVEQSTLALNRVVVEGNSADYGGGVAAIEAISVSVEDSTLRDNAAGSRGGGIFSNLGGGVALTGSTLSGNLAADGAGICANSTDYQVINTTISLNSASGIGGGLVMDGGDASLAHVTIADNTAVTSGGGLDIRNGGGADVRNSLIADNGGGNCGGSGVVSSGYNLSSDASCALVATGDLVNTPAGLDALGDNGGATQTQALLSGSAAIDLIPNGVNGCGLTFVSDQRSVVRPNETIRGCDAGAFEYLPNICTIYASTDVTNKKIPSNGTSGWMNGSTITIADGAPIADVNVLDVTGEHAMISDLEFTLTSPAGTSVSLFNTACTDRDFNIDFDDAAASAIFPCPPTNGNAYQPIGSLTDFDNEDSTGTWTLDILDNAASNTGKLLGWSLEVCTGTVVWVEDATQNEGVGTMTFTLNMSQASSVDVLIDYSTVDGTAVAGSDYVATSGTLTIPAGDTSATITVDIIDDAFYEINEGFVLDLGNPINAYLLPDDAIGTIINNDPIPAWACNTYTASDVGKIPASGNSGDAPRQIYSTT